MKRRIHVAMALAVLGGAPALVPNASAQVVAGGNNAQAIFDCQPFDADKQAVVAVTIPAGKRKRLLIVNAYTRGTGSGQSCAIAQNLDVGSGDGYGGSASGFQGTLDTATGTWWVDLDELEAADPGTIVGVPVKVTLNVFKSAASQCGGMCASLAVQVVKK